MFPNLLGGNYNNTQFNTVDADSNFNIVIGGGTSDSGLCSDNIAYVPHPIVVYILSGDVFLWNWVFVSNSDSNFDFVQHVEFTNDASKIILAFDHTNSRKFQIVILRSYDG